MRKLLERLNPLAKPIPGPGARRRVPGSVVAAALVLSLAGSAGVQAHGGNDALIHGCVQQAEDEEFVRIVGSDESCQEDEYPLDWLPGPPLPVGAPTVTETAATLPDPDLLSPKEKRAYSKVYAIKVSKDEAFSFSKTGIGTINTAGQPTGKVELTGECPPSHPYRYAGSSWVSRGKTIGVPAAEAVFDTVIYADGPVGEHGWQTVVSAGGAKILSGGCPWWGCALVTEGSVEFLVRIDLVCTKVNAKVKK